MKAFIFLLAAGIFLLPVCGVSAEKKDIHTVMTAEEGHASVPVESKDETGASAKEESALDEEMDELGDESLDTSAESASAATKSTGEKATDSDAGKPSGEVGYGYGTDEPLSASASVRTASAYAELTAIEPVTLADGDWAFIEGDERRGWFFDRAKMQRNSDGSISYWQLILYNDLGKAQFVSAMHDEAYRNVGYTLQRRVLDPKKNTIRTYEIIAYDTENAVITDSSRDGHAAEIRPHTMAAKERDAVKKAAKKRNIKNKSHT